MSEQSLQNAYWWFNTLAIWIPIIGAVIGALCALGAWRVNDRLDEFKRTAIRNAAALSQTVDVRTRPRTITQESWAAITRALTGAPRGRVKVTAVQTDGEAVHFGGQLTALLQQCGYSVEYEAPMMIAAGEGDPSPVGIHMSVKNADSIPPHALPIRDALMREGIVLSWIIKPGMTDPDLLLIIIRQKP